MKSKIKQYEKAVILLNLVGCFLLAAGVAAGFISFLVIVRGLIDGMFIYTRFSNRDEIVEKMIEKFWKMI